MARYAASRLVTGSYDEAVVRETAAQLRRELEGKPAFGLVFATPDYAEQAHDFLELIRLHGHVPTLVGCSGAGIIGQAEEQELGSGFSLMLVSVPGAAATPVTFTQQTLDEATGPEFWHHHTKLARRDVKAWLVFLDPFSLTPEPWLKQWNRAYPGVPIFGGLASGVQGDAETWLFHQDELVEGGVALALSGAISIEAVVSQGCKPIGEPLTVTQANDNILLTLGSRPAYEVLSDVYKELTAVEREQARGHLFAGLAVSEYVEDYKRGDFLVRNIIGADPLSGAVAINAVPRVGQTLQYQLRDPEAAGEELRSLLKATSAKLAQPPAAALLCTCNGRGRGLFGRPHHDAALINEFFPELPLTGLFANGEIGPVGDRSFMHAYTASIALIAPAPVSV